MASADANAAVTKAEAEGPTTREQVVAMLHLNDDPPTPDSVLIKELRRRADMEQECANTREATLMNMRSCSADLKDPEKYAKVKQQKAYAEANVKKLVRLRHEFAAAAHEIADKIAS